VSPRSAECAAVFDLDGTLIDSHRDIAAAVNEVLVALGRPPRAPAEVKSMIGNGVVDLLVRALGGDRSLLEEARASFREAYDRRLIETTRTYAGCEAMLAALADRGIGAVVATNKPASFTARILAGLGLDRSVLASASADEVGERKPSAAVVYLALERAGLSGIAYVGDMPLDVETARRAHLEPIGVGWGFDPAGIEGTGVQVAKEMADLVGLIEKARTSIRRTGWGGLLSR
jgi:phosphoglycolate phosphatase